MTESKSNIFNNIRIWIGDTITRGHVAFDSAEFSLVIESAELLYKTRQDIFYELDHEITIDESGEQFSAQLLSPVIIRLTPKFIVTRPYNRSATELLSDVHPPSSNGWYARMIRGKKNALYIIQELKDSSQLWMTVLDSDTNTILECHGIQQYEIEVLQLVDTFEHFNTLLRFFGRNTHAEMRKHVMRVLDETSLSWEDIYTLSRGWSIPIISRGMTSRETLTKLFPIDVYPEDTREEVLAFLAWTVKETFPKEDLVRFVEKLEGMPTFRSLLVDHLKILIDNRSIPSYLMLASSAATGGNSRGLSINEAQSQKPNVILRYKVYEMAPDWQAEAIQVVKSLDDRDEISLVLPKSKKTRSTERKRFLMSTMGFNLRAYLQPMNIGLQNIVYPGVAYRWAHRHLSYS